MYWVIYVGLGVLHHLCRSECIASSTGYIVSCNLAVYKKDYALSLLNDRS